MANKILNLDLSKDPIMPAIIYGRIADDRMQTVTVNITRRDEVADLTGCKITFEGTTHSGQTKVFDTNNVSSTSPGLKKGTFDYTFPNMAFAVAGKYDRAYFSITKDGKRDTTADFDILVTGNADIDAPEAKTIITEYNKLVDDLQKLQKQNISDLQKQQNAYIQSSDDEFKAIQARITDLETQIDNYEKAVGKMTSDAVSAVDEALNEFKAGAFYTQIESDNLFAKKTDLTKEKVNLGNVDNYATATLEEAESGLAKDKFMTPFLVFKAIAKWVQGKFVTPEDLLNKTYPIGSIYPSISSVNPELLFGGTWERFAKGQVLVGVDESDGDFAAGKAGGTKAHKLTINELPKHTVPLGLNRGPNPSASGSGTGGYLWGDVASGGKNSGSVGGDQPHNNLQPYIAVYMWKRTA
ncbi:phage baseplate protein [Enterococcus sp. 22-H-5-01]|uniref:phage baseplate protein n=1 Tax=Enterococcus sp. 22-H-5-01 TaxID=3418555 RepID=UPI003D056595